MADMVISEVATSYQSFTSNSAEASQRQPLPADSKAGSKPSGSSKTMIVIALIKGTLGPAILFVPHGFSVTGYAFAMPMMLLSLFVFLYSVRNLLECHAHVRAKKHIVITHCARKSSGSFVLENGGVCMEDVDDASSADLLLGGGGDGSDDEAGVNNGSMEDGISVDAAAAGDDDDDDLPHKRVSPVSLSYPTLVGLSLGPRMSSFVSVMLMCQQFGIVLTYLIFVPTNIQKVLAACGLSVSMNTLIKLMVMFQIPIAWVSDISKLSVTNITANVLIFYGLLSCLAYSLFINSDPVSVVANIPSLQPIVWETFYLFIGTSVLLFEGLIALAIPLCESITEPKLTKAFPNIIAKVLKCIVTFYCVFAITCWSSFKNPDTVFTASLPPGFFVDSVQLCYSVAVLLTFPLQNFPAIQILSKGITDQLDQLTTSGKSGKSWEGDYLVRGCVATSAVCVLGVVANLIKDNLDHLVSLIGAFFGIPLAFIVPSLMHNVIMSRDGLLTKRKERANLCVVIFGGVVMVVASTATLRTWNQKAQEDLT
jgi:proton-coupled amino acid transporter